MVSGLTHTYKIAEPAAHRPAEKASVSELLRSPLAVGRQAVRRILASICCSTRQLNAAAAPATNQLHHARLGQRVKLAEPGRNAARGSRCGGRVTGVHAGRLEGFNVDADTVSGALRLEKRTPVSSTCLLYTSDA